MQRNWRPYFDLNEIQELVRADSFAVTLRVANHLINHGFDPKEAVAGVFEAATAEHFQKSIRLKNRPEQVADVYSGIPYCGEEWYMKFFKDEEALKVRIWSLNIDGMIH